jgi:hypothetical protein
MGESKRGISRAEAQELVDARVSEAIREVVWLMTAVLPRLLRATQSTEEDREKLAAALEGVAETQKADGRAAAATAATALAQALRAMKSAREPG